MHVGNAVVGAEVNQNNDAQRQQELAYLKSMAFQGIVPNEPQPQEITQQEPQSTETVVQSLPTPTANDTEVIDIDVFLKDTFGFENIDAAKNAFLEYNQLKTATPQPQFSNEESKLMYDYIANNKEDDLYKKLEARQKIKNVENLNDQDKLKLYIRLQNPLFDDELINDEYNSLYTVSEDKFKNDLDEIDSLALRKEKLRAQQRIMNDVEKANDYFGQYKSKIEFQPLQQEQKIDENYSAYQSRMENDITEYKNNIEPAINNLRQDELAMQLKIEDTQNQMDFNLSIEVTPEDFQQAKADALDLEKYLNDSIYKDNKFIAANYGKMMLVSRNFDKYARSIARQAVMAERKRVTTTNAQGGVNSNVGRDYNLEGMQTQNDAYKFAFPGGRLNKVS